MGQYTNGLGSGGREGARGLAPSYLRAVPLLWVLHRMMAVPGSEDRARPATVVVAACCGVLRGREGFPRMSCLPPCPSACQRPPARTTLARSLLMD